MAAHSIISLVARYEAVGGSFDDLLSLDGVRGPRDDADVMSRRHELAVVDFVEAAERRYATAARAAQQVEAGTATWRTTKNGQWVAYGPATVVVEGQDVTITRRDDTRSVRRVASVGRPFDVDGIAMVYGYLAPEIEKPVKPAKVARHSALYGEGFYYADQPGATYYDGGRTQIWDHS